MASDLEKNAINNSFLSSNDNEHQQPTLPASSTNSVLEKDDRSRPQSSHIGQSEAFRNDAATAEGAPLERVETSPYPKSWKLIGILVAVSLSTFLVALDMTIIGTALPRITDQFHSLDDVGWYGSAFFLTLASFQSTWGKTYKYFPLKTAFLVSVAIFELGSLICALATSSTMLIVGRAIAGIGGAGISSGAYTILAFSAPPKQVAALTGILGAVYAVASVVGPLLGGVFTDDLSWRWCFYINLPIGGTAAAIILLIFTTPIQAKPQSATWKEKFLQMDPIGVTLLMGACICFILALQWGGTTKSWGSSSVVGTLVGFAVLLALFIANEMWQGERAAIVPRLLKRKTIALMSMFQFFNAGNFVMLLYYLPIYFQVVSGTSAASSGVRNLPFILGISLFTIVSGVGITTTGDYIPYLVLGPMLSTIGSGLLYTLDIGSPSGHWIGYQALAGIGVGLGIQVPMIVGQGSVDVIDIPSVTAITMFFISIAGAISVTIAQTVFTNELLQAVPRLVPSVDPHLIVGTGATQLRSVFSAEELPGIIRSFMIGLKDTYAQGVALAGLAFIVGVATLVFDRRKLRPGQATAAA